MEDKTAVNYKTDTGDPPKSVPASPIELSGKTQKEKITKMYMPLTQHQLHGLSAPPLPFTQHH